jgi:hypothetical protein
MELTAQSWEKCGLRSRVEHLSGNHAGDVFSRLHHAIKGNNHSQTGLKFLAISA